MRYLHTMLRVRNLDTALDFYCNKLGLKEVRRRVDEKNKYTLVFLAGPDDEKLVNESKKAGRDAPLVELTFNWGDEDVGDEREVALGVQDVRRRLAGGEVDRLGERAGQVDVARGVGRDGRAGVEITPADALGHAE